MLNVAISFIQYIERRMDEFDDTPKENCGVFGIYAPELPIATTVSLALIALQHRGQEACGIVTYDEKKNRVNSHKGVGLVSQVFSNEDVLKPLKGNIGIGHTRYATAGKSTAENAQPVIVETHHGFIGISQNGNLTTHASLRKELLKRGFDIALCFILLMFYSVGMFRDSDIEVIAQMLSSNAPGYDPTKGPQWEQRISSFMHEVIIIFLKAFSNKFSLTELIPLSL